MTEQKILEARSARKQATIPVVVLAIVVAYYALFNSSDPFAPLIGSMCAIWGLYILLQFRYSWTLLISALVLIFGGVSLLFS